MNVISKTVVASLVMLMPGAAFAQDAESNTNDVISEYQQYEEEKHESAPEEQSADGPGDEHAAPAEPAPVEAVSESTPEEQPVTLPEASRQ